MCRAGQKASSRALVPRTAFLPAVAPVGREGVQRAQGSGCTGVRPGPDWRAVRGIYPMPEP